MKLLTFGTTVELNGITLNLYCQQKFKNFSKIYKISYYKNFFSLLILVFTTSSSGKSHFSKSVIALSKLPIYVW